MFISRSKVIILPKEWIMEKLDKLNTVIDLRIILMHKIENCTLLIKSHHIFEFSFSDTDVFPIVISTYN